MRRSVVVIVVAGLLAACTGGDSATPSTSTGTTAPAPTATSPPAPPPGSTTTTATPSTTHAPTSIPADIDSAELRWWNDRVFYEVFVRSFRDSDGDGIGDLAGLTASLDYLNDGDPATTDDLGITGIWLMPIFPSPSYHGYDVTDYYGINPDYGTADDFADFVDAAHERGIAVLIDLVINHTSVEHPWFEASAAGDETYADWYVWSDTASDLVSPWNGGPVWHQSGERYYFGLFWEGMPDLALTNPDVTAELYDIADYWLTAYDVDGFRLDAARHLIEDGATMSDTPATRDWLEAFTSHVHAVDADALVLGEVWSPTENVAAYIPDALDLAFEFGLAEAGADALAIEDAAVLGDATAVVRQAYPPSQFATFLTNHDMERLMSAAGGDVRVAKLAATWLLTGPGVPFVYYGEEVGLQGRKPDERIRTPMPWTADPPGLGFTTGEPWQPVHAGFGEFNVADQMDDPESLLTLYRSLIHDRSSSVALRRGDLVPVSSDHRSVWAALRTSGDDHVLVVLNLSSAPAFDVTLDLATGPLAGMQGVVPVVGSPAYAPEINTNGGFDRYRPLESIPAYGYLVLRFASDPTPPPPVTVAPTVDDGNATTADAAFATSVIEGLASGDDALWASAFAPDAVLIDNSGSPVPLSTALPADAGFDDSWDWDGDGSVTIRDVVAAQNAWGAVIVTNLEIECTPVRDEVVCNLVQADVFGEAAGLPATTLTQSYRIEDGRVAALAQLARDDPSGSEPWLEQFAAYEEWVSIAHPDLFPIVFRDPCCVGTPDGLLFTRASVDAQRDLVDEWWAGRTG